MKQPIPWAQLFYEGCSFFRKPDHVLVSFFLAFFLLAIPSQSDLPDLRNLNPFQMWYWMAGILGFFAVSYFVFVAFVLWIQIRSKGGSKINIRQIVRTAVELMLPLSILSIRGAFLCTVGLILLIIPGLYFSFKYELASFCLILEGWQENAPPLVRTEQIISKYGLALLFLPCLMMIEWMSSFLMEGIVKLSGIEMGTGVRIGIGLADSMITVFLNIYMTLVVLFLLKTVKPSHP